MRCQNSAILERTERPARPETDGDRSVWWSACLAGLALGLAAAWWFTRRARDRDEAGAGSLRREFPEDDGSELAA